MKLLRLCAPQLKLNEPLPWNVRNEPGHLLLGKGFVLKDQAHIDALLTSGIYVDIAEHQAHEQALIVAQQQRPNPFSLWADILQRTGKLLRNHKANPHFVQDIGTLSTQIQSAMHDNVDIGTFEMLNGDTQGYSVDHSVQTAFVASLAAARLGWSGDDQATLIRASLTMNIAMLDMQNTLTQQTSPLTPQQKAAIAAHPTKGRHLLEESGVRCQNWLSAVEQHHITTDGKGLPQQRDHLSPLACLIHYADVYLAKLSPRATRPAMPVNVAARELFLKAEGAKNPYVAAIIQEMGIFPPGSFVKLANGDTAVVVRPGESADTPHVHSLITADGWICTESSHHDTAKPEFKIVATVPRGNVLMRLDRQKLFGYAAA